VSEQEFATIQTGLRASVLSEGYLELDRERLQEIGIDFCDQVVLEGEAGAGRESFLNLIRDGEFFPDYSGGFPEPVVQNIGVMAELTAVTMCQDLLGSSQ
jgi:hypothetical protein